MWREIFAYATNPEIFLDAENVRSLVDRLDGGRAVPVPETLQSSLAAFQAAIDASEVAWSQLANFASTFDVSDRLKTTIAVQAGPLAASLGAWNQGASAPSLFEDETNLKRLALLADDVGVGQPEASRYDAFRDIVRSIGLSVSAVGGPDLVFVRDIRDQMFGLPAIIQALSRRSDAFLPEIAGIDLSFRSIGPLPIFRLLSNPSQKGSELSRLDLSRAQLDVLGNGVSPIEVSGSVASVQAELRVRDGVWWSLRGYLHWDRCLRDLCRAHLDPRLAMALLVRERAREAGVYHGEFKLAGRSLAQWFKDAETDPLPLVDELAASALVKRGDPDRSALLGMMVRPNGRMFRVFRKVDIDVIRSWILSLDASIEAKPVSTPQIAALDPLPPPWEAQRGDTALGSVPPSIWEAYHILQGPVLAPRTRLFAHSYVQRWLSCADASIDKTDRSLPKTWSMGCLRSWLLGRHDQHAEEFNEHKLDEFPAREMVIDQTVQLAPLTLIDGAWLQGFTDYAAASSRVGFSLFETYWDELGNGKCELNHPRIYRDVLRAMDIELPPTGSAAFAADPRLRDASFRLPVYWLCLGKLPVTFRAEILGMNLAMELSGVGGSYRLARRFLKHYGFPTVFVDVHNTIDNVSTGHSAWAADAIDAYMRSAVEHCDCEAEWTRIRRGFESLAPIVRSDEELNYFGGKGAGRPLALSGKPIMLSSMMIRKAGANEHA